MRRNVYSRIFEIIIVTAYICLGFGCNNAGDVSSTSLSQQPDSLGCTIQKTFPHDTSSFTEGLLIYKGALYESTGEYGKSKLLKIDLRPGKIEKQLDLDPKYFGEGIVILSDTIYQLTYKEKALFVYDLDFKKIRQDTITTDNGQGWGMTTDGINLIVDDGTDNLYFYEPSTFKLIKKLSVTDAGSPGYNLNELEYIDGYIYANQWQLPYILKIDPSNGKVVAKGDLTVLWNRLQQKAPKANVLNGIAFDAETKKIYITGKNWPELYEVRFK
ncbi:MAG TPA: glutaminyl-peptide cyclotransferase [Chitinophagaceae bacterium]|jgi:glutamine cyclotransferase|nr:glutaminyl-peptide cyclotransferase [Chitinophagaceae bacterium]